MARGWQLCPRLLVKLFEEISLPSFVKFPPSKNRTFKTPIVQKYSVVSLLIKSRFNNNHEQPTKTTKETTRSSSFHK